MISSIEWIPAGIADPNPKKYELSSTEQELIQMIDEHGNFVTSNTTTSSSSSTNVTDDNARNPNKEFSRISRNTRNNNTTKTQLPKMEHNLPPDLRMDEYSDDDDDETDERRTATIGRLLVSDGNDDNDQRMEDEYINDVDEQNVLKDIDDDHGIAQNDHDDDDDDDRDANKRNDHDNDDDDDDDDDLADVPDTREYEPVDVEGLEAMGFGGVTANFHGDDAFHDDNDDDDESELEDVALTPDDALVLVAKTEDDFASLEVYVYDQKNGNLFVHHDIPLPAFPLCLAHGQVSRHAITGNFCAVGTFSPGIEIWNLDVLNALEPSCVLGGEDNSITDELMKLQIVNAATGSVKNNTSNNRPKTSRLKASKSGLRHGSHTDAVMSLSWNPIHRQVIASGSADRTVKLWDVTKATSDDANATTYTHHKNKVQSVAWNPQEGTLLATGSYDRTVALLDARTNGNKSNIKQVRIPADCETIVWDPTRTEYLTVLSEDGIINCWDVRKFETSTPLWSLSASEFGGVTDLSYNSLVPGLMVTCSIDKTISLWDAHNMDASCKVLPPKPCGSKDMCVGKLYSVGFYPSSPWLLGCGGSGNELALWDLSSEESIQKGFLHRMDQATREASSKATTENTLPQTLGESFDAMMNNSEKMKDGATTDEGVENGASVGKESSSLQKKKAKKGKLKPKVHRKI